MATRKTIQRIPLVAMIAFVFFYVLAALNYPGGSGINPYFDGFSLRYNYLCDLLDTYSVGGALNSGRLWARMALVVLSLGLILLWIRLPELLWGKGWQGQFMRINGILALGITLFLASENHDLVLRLAGVFGILAVGFAIAGLWRSNHIKLAGFGIWCLLIFLINYLLYETGSLLTLLPVIQKITFLSFIFWFAWMNLLKVDPNTEQTLPPVPKH
ncbi:MAG: hypothetical protein RLZZ241_1961 [Bacteroidota bacterium]|jgi:hypothetical protein